MGLKFCGVSYLKCRLYLPPLWNVGFYSCRAHLLLKGRKPHVGIKVGRSDFQRRGLGKACVSLQEQKCPLLMKGLTPFIWPWHFQLSADLSGQHLICWETFKVSVYVKSLLSDFSIAFCCSWSSPKTFFSFEKLQSRSWDEACCSISNGSTWTDCSQEVARLNFTKTKTRPSLSTVVSHDIVSVLADREDSLKSGPS